MCEVVNELWQYLFPSGFCTIKMFKLMDTYEILNNVTENMCVMSNPKVGHSYIIYNYFSAT